MVKKLRDGWFELQRDKTNECLCIKLERGSKAYDFDWKVGRAANHRYPCYRIACALQGRILCFRVVQRHWVE